MRKFKRAVTDSEAKVCIGEEKHGINNLIGIYSAVTGKTAEQVTAEFEGKVKVVKVNGEQVILSDGQYTIKNIKEDKVITVEEVKLNTYRVILPDEADQIGYTLAFKAGGTGTVDYGSSCGFTFELDEAYDRSSYTVRVNGTPVGIANNEYTIQNIRADQVITVENVKMNEYTISIPNYQTGYTLKAYTGSSSPVYHGGNFTLQFILLEGYDQSLSTFKLKLDGAEIQTALSPDGLYTISNVTNDHVLTVEGIKINTYSIIYRYYMGATELTKQLEVNHGADVHLAIFQMPMVEQVITSWVGQVNQQISLQAKQSLQVTLSKHM